MSDFLVRKHKRSPPRRFFVPRVLWHDPLESFTLSEAWKMRFRCDRTCRWLFTLCDRSPGGWLFGGDFSGWCTQRNPLTVTAIFLFSSRSSGLTIRKRGRDGKVEKTVETVNDTKIVCFFVRMLRRLIRPFYIWFSWKIELMLASMAVIAI